MKTTLSRVSDSIHVFNGSYPGGGNVTATIFHSGTDAFVFDSLLRPNDTRVLLHAIKDLNLTIKGLVNTHWHIDHTAGNQLFLETSRIISHSLCGGLMHTEGAGDPDWAKEALKLDEKDRIKRTYPNEAIRDGSKLFVENKEIEVLHTPGHTPDSIIGVMKDEGVIIAGDTVMGLPYVGLGDSKALIDSLTKVRSISKGRKVIQGHGGICGDEKLNHDIKYLEDIRKMTAEFVDSGKTADQASEKIKLEDCVTKERFESLSNESGFLLWCHPSNVKRIYKELKEGRA